MPAHTNVKQGKDFTEIGCHSETAMDNIFAHKNAFKKLTLKQATGFARLTHKQNA